MTATKCRELNMFYFERTIFLCQFQFRFLRLPAHNNLLIVSRMCSVCIAHIWRRNVNTPDYGKNTPYTLLHHERWKCKGLKSIKLHLMLTAVACSHFIVGCKSIICCIMSTARDFFYIASRFLHIFHFYRVRCCVASEASSWIKVFVA